MNARLKRSPRLLLLLWSVAAGGVAGGVLMVWVRTEIQSQRRELAELVAREREQAGRGDALRAELAELTAPARIEEKARALGLVFPSPATEPAGWPRPAARQPARMLGASEAEREPLCPHAASGRPGDQNP